MNVLISAEGRALLTDFGHSHLANSSFSMTVDLPRGGSWNWLAPENIESDQYAITLPGDIWAFGMTVLVCFLRKSLTAVNRQFFRNCFLGKNPSMMHEMSQASYCRSCVDHLDVQMMNVHVLA